LLPWKPWGVTFNLLGSGLDGGSSHERACTASVWRPMKLGHVDCRDRRVRLDFAAQGIGSGKRCPRVLMGAFDLRLRDVSVENLDYLLTVIVM
jgi:hypothetical protein